MGKTWRHTGHKVAKGAFSQLILRASQAPRSPADTRKNPLSNQSSSLLAFKENHPIRDRILLFRAGNLHFVSYRKQKNFQTLKLKPQKDRGDELGDGNQLLQQSLGFRVTEIFIGRRGTRQEMASFHGLEGPLASDK